jgi:hypothetical protein
MFQISLYRIFIGCLFFIRLCCGFGGKIYSLIAWINWRNARNVKWARRCRRGSWPDSPHPTRRRLLPRHLFLVRPPPSPSQSNAPPATTSSSAAVLDPSSSPPPTHLPSPQRPAYPPPRSGCGWKRESAFQARSFSPGARRRRPLHGVCARRPLWPLTASSSRPCVMHPVERKGSWSMAVAVYGSHSLAARRRT